MSHRLCIALFSKWLFSSCVMKSVFSHWPQCVSCLDRNESESSVTWNTARQRLLLSLSLSHVVAFLMVFLRLTETAVCLWLPFFLTSATFLLLGGAGYITCLKTESQQRSAFWVMPSPPFFLDSPCITYLFVPPFVFFHSFLCCQRKQMFPEKRAKNHLSHPH